MLIGQLKDSRGIASVFARSSKGALVLLRISSSESESFGLSLLRKTKTVRYLLFEAHALE